MSSSLCTPILGGGGGGGHRSLTRAPSAHLKGPRWTGCLAFAGIPSRRGRVICMAPQEERKTKRNPLDFPAEWETRRPRRADIFPKFSPMKTPLPPPMPADPPMPDDDDDPSVEEEEKNEEEGEEEEDHDDKPVIT